MLKALEIVGFKSFADRTRFEFPPGITVVVGPNGSGKSNIVDAIKWALGEQSVKSLRGQEMADVIFNGSSSRRAMNSAEITLSFDNTKRQLPVDAPEVHITRRVYRGGEGEYLINRSPARLRDIRDLLSGTGMGRQAYSVIEQGKVDVLLQSSAQDRRVIFEEAAGISRFKVRKVEALRRLERVQQNLLRLSDIIDEVEGRLRSVRTQAGKARRYKQHTDRLQELRTQVAQVDWRRLSEQLSGIEAQLQSLGQEHGGALAEAENVEAQQLDADNQLAALVEEIRRVEAVGAVEREKIATVESAIEHERNRAGDLAQEIARHRRQLAAMSARAGDLQQQLRDAADSLEAAEQNHREVARRLAEAERAVTDLTASLDRLRGENEQSRAAYLEQTRQAAALDSEIGILESRASAAAAVCQRCSARTAELEAALGALHGQLEDLRQERARLTDEAQRQASALAEAKERLDGLRARQAAGQKELSELRERQSGAAERAAVLEELIGRYDGLEAGVKEVLQRAAGPQPAAFSSVVGLLADLLRVSVEAAPLVEIALGEAAQHVVATASPELLELLETESSRLGGRVGFVWLDGDCPHLRPSEGEKGDRHHLCAAPGTDRRLVGPFRQMVPVPFFPIDLEGQPGVLGRADRFVEADARLSSLAARLLGQTWFVDKLATALKLAQSVCGAAIPAAHPGETPAPEAARAGETPAPQLRFVTAAGELLQPDGTLIVGPRNAAVGLISQRSQLRSLRVLLGQLAASIEAADGAAGRLADDIDAQQALLERRAAEHQQAIDALTENRVALSAAEGRQSQWDQQRAALDQELGDARQQQDSAAARLADSQQKRAPLRAATAEMESVLRRLAEQIAALEDRRSAQERETTDVKVELAKSEERMRNLHVRRCQVEESRQERDRAIEEAAERLAESSRRAEAGRRAILQAEAQLADLYLRKEALAAEVVARTNRREALQARRNALAPETQRIRARLRKIEEQTHAADLSANEVRHQRTSLADRLREDYRIELAELDRHFTPEEQHQREAVQQEIEELRQKINNLGNVNLEALAELEELESRHQSQVDQHRDLVSAKASLEKIIEKINADSRRLFAETLETVKGHFQTLFRDLFGGGRADIVLDEGVDILDSGVEIVARPPGKEPRSISLLSGGEKTMTCVALLLAIFRSRPSPFCVLDEVDAALDEANIDRFTQVLKDFLAWTQFIIVTHSKKTMICANTIYGLTMQESGVTKQVSVRFEDVSDDGHILTPSPADGETQAA
jgi:chromosome segregation protein